MSYEIEAKIKVPTLDGFNGTLKELGAKFMHNVHQTDTYLMDTHQLLYKNGFGLRIRQQNIDGEQTALITFKGAPKKAKFKARPEYETGIDNVEMMEKIFEAIGYHKELVVKKTRSMWQLDNCEICLDELPLLGCFIEVEGPDEDTISSVLKKLNLHNEPHISNGYASMMSRELKQE